MQGSQEATPPPTLASYVSKYHALPRHEKMELRGFSLMLLSRFLAKAKPRLWTADERVQAFTTDEHKNGREKSVTLATRSVTSWSIYN